MSLLTKIFGDPNEKELKKLAPIVEQINNLESNLEKLTDEELQAKTNEFKQRLQKGETLDDLLVEAFAVVREAAKRVLNMRHYDVQLIGGIALHQGKIAEMRTGEGKTLVATLPVYLNALEGKGVHVITVNDYLAKRDAVWMGHLYNFLGLSVGIIQNQRISYRYQADKQFKIFNDETNTDDFKVENDYLEPISRQQAYQCDITYGTNNEFGFDYLRDNMVQSISEMVMRPGSEMNYAVIDEIDSILIDEARTPLIISAPAEQATEQYYQFAKLVKQLKENEDYNVDEKMRSVTLTDQGIAKFEKWLNLDNIYVEGGMQIVHHIEQALKAEVLFKKDKDYIVDNGEVIIIDEFTGRKMPGRRYSEGLHQAIEAKEGVEIQRESQTLARITFQNLFKMYRKLSGMTGTAATEAEEFSKIYNLEVLIIPTNRPDRRIDHPDRIYKTELAKFKAIAEKIKECQTKGQPILIGTISVEKNEQLANYLQMQGIEFEALNAKNHEREGEIIAQAGRPGSVTLATNMAGRGVDIKLGGVPANPEDKKKVIQAGGLFVLGTERHESRRIDNQLRGRSARQGDPGETQFYVSTEDDLMRIFAGDKLKAIMSSLRVPDDMPIEQKMISRLLETAQKKVESHNFDIRKHLLEYDNVLNKQREVIYKKRRLILELADIELRKIDGGEAIIDQYIVLKTENYDSLKDLILKMIEDEIELIVSFHTNTETKEEWNMEEIYESVKTMFDFNSEEKQKLFAYAQRTETNDGDIELREQMIKYLITKAKNEYDKLEQAIKETVTDLQEAQRAIVYLEKNVLLRTIDNLWVDYLVAIDYLRTSIGLRGYAQRDPLVEYKKESFGLFNKLLANIQKDVVFSIFKVGVGLRLAPTIMANDKLTLSGAKKSNSESGFVKKKPINEKTGKKIGRNDPCPCGSGKKYKKCCGRNL